MSSHIQVELDALHKAADVAALLNVDEDVVIAGLNRLWVHCYREKTSTVPDAVLRAKFKGRVDGATLAEFGFVMRGETGWYVKGTGRYVRAQEACSKGGHAAKGNLIPGGPKAAEKRSAAAETKPSRSRRAAQKQPSMSLGSTSALDPKSEILNPKSTTSSAPPDGEPVAAPGEYQGLTDALVEAFAEECGRAAYVFGGRDWKALAKLRKLADHAEILTRWRRALRSTHPETKLIHELEMRWNRFATDSPKANGKAPVVLTEQSNAALSHVGEVQW